MQDLRVIDLNHQLASNTTSLLNYFHKLWQFLNILHNIFKNCHMIPKHVKLLDSFLTYLVWSSNSNLHTLKRREMII